MPIDHLRHAARERDAHVPELVIETADGERTTLARGMFAQLASVATGVIGPGDTSRFTHTWGGWRRPLEVRVTKWRGIVGDASSIWRSVAAGHAFAPMFYARLALARWRDRRAGLDRAGRHPLPVARTVRR